MTLYVGTSGYAYKEWKGYFYPEKIAADEMLRFYATKLRTVEINNTFYRMPKEAVVTAWAEQVGPEFRFILKASQKITHFKRLKDVGSELEYFLKAATLLGEKRGPTLFQLPPNMKKDLPRLTDFLALIPKRWRAAFEFRHETWYGEDVYDALRSANAALVLADNDEGPEPAAVATADWGYLRLRRENYDDAALQGWVTRVTSQQWSDTFVFFKHEEAGAGPAMAARFEGLAGAG
ncbi:MAG TPA: DUF72 domain-containing protein [Gemmatimonadales bacterium]|nr:DUF72 domain-containing protein [Gemmatimonadales bacterium]